MVEQTAFRGSLWAALAWSNSCAKCSDISLCSKAWSTSVLADVEKERQNGTDGDWQQDATVVDVANVRDRVDGIVGDLRETYLSRQTGDVFTWEPTVGSGRDQQQVLLARVLLNRGTLAATSSPQWAQNKQEQTATSGEFGDPDGVRCCQDEGGPESAGEDKSAQLLIAAFLEEMRNVEGLADFDSCETSLR